MPENSNYSELKEISDLRPHPENPREVSKAAAAGLRYSIESFGDLSGIVWNVRNGRLVCGHQRVAQLTEAGARLSNGALEIEATGLDFPIREVDWPEDKHREAMVAANNEAIQGRWTVDTAAMIAKVREANRAGYDALRLADILKRAPKPPSTVINDDLPEAGESIAKVGDRWHLGRHTVVCGDSLTVPIPKGVAAVITDPPYSERTHKGHMSGNDITRTQPIGYEPIDTDVMRAFADSWSCFPWVVAFADDLSFFGWRESFGDCDMYCFGAVGWVKPHAAPRFSSDGPTCSVEWIAVARPKHMPKDRRSRPGHYMADKPPHSYLVGQKPITTIAALVGDYSQPGDTVADPFLGTGTTLLACEQTDRTCFGVELEPSRVDLVIKRWENLTGAKAKRAKG